MNTSNLIAPHFRTFRERHEKKHEYKARLIESGLTPVDISLLFTMESFDPPLRRDRSPAPFYDQLKLRGRHLFGITLKPSKLAALSQELRSVQAELRDMYMMKETDEKAKAAFAEREGPMAARLGVVYNEVQEWRKKMRDVDPFGGVRIGGGKGGLGQDMVTVVTEEEKVKEGKVIVDEEEVGNEKATQEEGVEMDRVIVCEEATAAGEAETAKAESFAAFVEDVAFIELVEGAIPGEETLGGEEPVLAEALAALNLV